MKNRVNNFCIISKLFIFVIFFSFFSHNLIIGGFGLILTDNRILNQSIQTGDNTTVYSLSDLPDVKNQLNYSTLTGSGKKDSNISKFNPLSNIPQIIQINTNQSLINQKMNNLIESPVLTVSSVNNPSDFSIELSSGWNFISTPKSLSTGNNTFEIFEKINTSSHSIYRHDPVQGWEKIQKSEIFEPCSGIWIYSEKRNLVPLYYNNEKFLKFSGKTLKKGWNAIGLLSEHSFSTVEALTSVSDKWVFLIPYNTTTHASDTPIIKGWKGRYSDNYPLYPGKGYWLYMSTDGVLLNTEPNPDINITGTVKYKTEMANGWSFSIPGTINGSISPDTGKLSIKSTDAIITYGGKTYPLKMDINAFLEQ